VFASKKAEELANNLRMENLAKYRNKSATPALPDSSHTLHSATSQLHDCLRFHVGNPHRTEADGRGIDEQSFSSLQRATTRIRT